MVAPFIVSFYFLFIAYMRFQVNIKMHLFFNYFKNLYLIKNRMYDISSPMSKRNELHRPMVPREFERCLETLGLSQQEYAVIAGISYQTINKRSVGRSKVPNEGVLLLRLLAERPELLPILKGITGKNDALF